MSGIWGIYKTTGVEDIDYGRYLSSYNYPGIINKKFRISENTVFGRSSINKFGADRFNQSENGSFFLNEGVLLNFEKNQLPNVFISSYRENPELLFDSLTGTYSGAIDNKDEIILYNDYVSSKPLYYFVLRDQGGFLFSSELQFFPPVLKKLGIEIQPDTEAWKELSVFGYLLGTKTLINGVSKLKRNSVLHFSKNTGKVSVSKAKPESFEGSDDLNLEEIFNRIDGRFKKIIDDAHQKDISYGYRHLHALSGGLDSRVNVGLSFKSGYFDMKLLTFSESGVAEGKCASDFAASIGKSIDFIPLDNGKYLSTSLLPCGITGDGIVGIQGAAHQFYALENYKLDDSGIFHTGQLGDAVFGTFTGDEESLYRKVRKQCFFRNDDYFDKLFSSNSGFLQYGELGNKGYPLFIFEERFINGTLNGDRVSTNFTDSFSPFCDHEIIQLMYGLPADKYNGQKIYIDFLKSRYPFMLDSKIDRSFFKPKNYTVYKYGCLAKKVWRKFIDPDSMVPFGKWFRENKKLSTWLIGERNKLLAEYGSEQVINEYANLNEKDIMACFQSLTLLLAYDLHFGKNIVNKLPEKYR